MTTLHEARLSVVALEALGDELNALVGRLQQLPTTVLDAIDQACDAIVQAELDAKLRATPARDLGGGLRYGVLESAGVTTVADVLARRYDQLVAIAGVGDTTASTLTSLAQAYAAAARAHVRLLPDPDRRRVGDTELLQALAAFDAFRRQVQPGLDDYVQRAATTAQQALAHLRAHRVWNGVFSAKKRTSAKDGSDRFRAAFSDLRDQASAQLALVDPSHQDAVALWQRYQANNAGFVALLEQAPAARRTASGLAAAGPNPRLVPNAPDPFGGLPPDLASRIEAFALQPGPLVATLRRYQEFGARFLATQTRCVLGDDMGLGKTVQVLAYMCHLHATGSRHFFVVAPNSVLVNWTREVEKHTTLTPYSLHGSSREANLATWRREGGVAVTTYGTLASLLADLGPVDLLVADEAHYAKNPTAQRTQSLQYAADRSANVALLTGTALENRLDELGSLVTLVNPKLEDLVATLTGAVYPDPDQTRTELAQVYLRRTQADVLAELPERTETFEWVSLAGADAAAYQQALNTAVSLVTVRQAAVLGAGAPTSAKFERLGELLDNYRSEGRKVVVFSFFRKVLDLVVSVAGGGAQINGSVSAAERQRVVDVFSATEGFAVLACQIDAAGLGMNLQAAQVVILMEPQLKPSAEHQAIARVHRMGQTRRVLVHRLVAKDTVEAWVLQLLAAKQQIFDAYADPSALKEASQMAIDPTTVDVEAELQALVDAHRAPASGAPSTGS